MINKPILSKQAFWDVDMDKIDYKKHARYVMEKTLERGSFEDFLSVLKFYGEKKFSKEIVKSNWLGDKEINLCCVIFDLKPTDFKCYMKKQLNPQLWVY